MDAVAAPGISFTTGRRPRPLELEAARILERSLAPLKEVMRDPEVTEIMVNSPEVVFVEDRSGMHSLDVVFDESQLTSCLHAIMRLNSKEISPIMDARLPGFRIAAALPPIAIHGPMIVIRKHASRRFRLREYVEQGGFTRVDPAAALGDDGLEETRIRVEREAAQGEEGLERFLRWAVRARKNLLVVGGTASGKTSLAASLLCEVPDSDRIITCEDTWELMLDQPNVLQFEALFHPGPARCIPIRSLIRLCLRSRPDRIVVGEVRGEEAYDFIDAMNTGHSGSVCTVHADSAAGGLTRLESTIRMSSAAANLPLRDMRAQIATAIDYVIFQSRLAGKRGPQEVLSLQDVDDAGHYVYHPVFSRLLDHPME